MEAAANWSPFLSTACSRPGLLLVDYDNDGWLDLLAFGAAGCGFGAMSGKKGFADVTAALGLDKTGPVDDVVAADFDQDGDTDLVMASGGGPALLAQRRRQRQQTVEAAIGWQPLKRFGPGLPRRDRLGSLANDPDLEATPL